MDIRQLKYFIAIVEHKSFTKASNALHIAQPALGLQIRKLEHELKVRLLERHSRGAEPTEAGQHLLVRARAVMDQLQSAKNELLDISSSPCGRVVVGMSPSIAAMLGASLVQAGAKKLPGVALVLVEEVSPVLAEWLAGGRLDIALGYDILQSASVAGDPLLTEDLYLVQAPGKPGSRSETLPLSMLGNYSLVLPAHPHPLRAHLDEKANEAGIALQIRCEMHSVQVIKGLVELGFAATILPYGAVHRECSQGRLIASKVVSPILRRTAYLGHRVRKIQSRTEIAVIELIRALVKDQEGPAAVWRSASPFVPGYVTQVA